MIGCTGGGRGGGGGSRNPAFNSSTTPISESVEMMTKHTWADADNDFRRCDVENNGATVLDIDETKVRIPEEEETNGVTPATNKLVT